MDLKRNFTEDQRDSWRPELVHLHLELPFQQYQTLPLLSHHMPALHGPKMGNYGDDCEQFKLPTEPYLLIRNGLTFVTRFSAIPFPMFPRPMKPTVLFAGAESNIISQCSNQI